MRVQAKGFTLFELVIVLLIVAAVATYIGIRLPSTTLFRQSSISEQLRRDIRYTQTLAMSLDSTYSIVFTSNSYTITPAPPRGAYTVTMPTGVTLSAGSITFSATGAPAAAGSVTITGGGSTTTLTVAAETGFVNG